VKGPTPGTFAIVRSFNSRLKQQQPKLCGGFDTFQVKVDVDIDVLIAETMIEVNIVSTL
jgi:hypothetical protein